MQSGTSLRSYDAQQLIYHKKNQFKPTNIKFFIIWHIKCEIFYMTTILADYDPSSELCWAEPKWEIWRLINLKFSMCSAKGNKLLLKQMSIISSHAISQYSKV